MEDYPYSSFASYFRSDRYKSDDIILNLMRKDDLERYHFEKDENEEDFLDIDNLCAFSTGQIVKMILRTGYIQDPSEIKLLSGDQQTEVIRMLLRAGVPFWKIHDVTNAEFGIISALSKEIRK